MLFAGCGGSDSTSQGLMQCSDGEQGGDESDVDCGGTCGACEDGKQCGVAADCDSGVCSESICAAPSCGDSVVNGDDVCDDGNTEDDDGCAGNCASDETCGNGISDTPTGEECDDGNTMGGDACRADCTLPVRYSDVQSIFAAKCDSCHTTGGSGGHNIGTSYSDSQLTSYTVADGTKAEASLVRIQNGSMPQGAGCSGNPVTDAGDDACLTAMEQAQIQQWLDDGQLE